MSLTHNQLATFGKEISTKKPFLKNGLNNLVEGPSMELL